MRLIQSFNIRDIKEYERNNRVSIIDMLQGIDFENLGELVRLGNPGISEEDAFEIMDDYIMAGHTVLDIYEEIRKGLFGENTNSENKETRDLSNYKNLTSFYSEILGDLRTYDDLGYSEAWSMNTDDLFLEFEILSKRLMDKTQADINNGHMLAVFLAQALSGNLPQEPPQINKAKKAPKKDNGLSDNANNAMILLKSIKRGG